MSVTLIAQSVVPVFCQVSGNTYDPTYVGEPFVVPNGDVPTLKAAGWLDAGLMSQFGQSAAPTARAIPVVDVGGYMTPNNTYAGVFPPKNLEDALANIFARLAAAHL
ncbi:hypothetical protein [Paraburkholderia oxyphila]|uniref:hypothetical protein n=1 Tax=Paraburkholderia oxyphila TaxID=614212 RepID=UPI0004894E7A|nr:hypothetical protein [Paraburkholderia oxyphila]